jgi:hypothetical protein
MWSLPSLSKLPLDGSSALLNMINNKLKELNNSVLTKLTSERSIEFNAVTVSWEDGERALGSAYGPRINDVYIVQTPTSGHTNEFKPTVIVRSNNFTDHVVRTSTLDVEVAPVDGSRATVVSMSLAYVLKHFLNYTTDTLLHSGEYTNIDLTSSLLHSQSHVYPTRYNLLENDTPDTITHYRSLVPLSGFAQMLESLISKFHRGLGVYDEAVTQRVMTAWLTTNHGETPEFVVRINPYSRLALVLIDYSIDGVRKSSWHLIKRTTTDVAIRRQENGKWVVKRFNASKNRELTNMDTQCGDSGSSSCNIQTTNDASRIRVIIIPLNSDFEQEYGGYAYDDDKDYEDYEDDDVPVYRSASAIQPAVYTARMNAGSVHAETDSYDQMYRDLSQCKRADAPITITDCFYVIQSDVTRINDTAVTNRVSMMMDFFKSRAREVATIHEQMTALFTR